MKLISQLLYFLFKATRHERVQFLSHYIPRRKNLWVFGAWQGNTYSDNPKYMFEYINKEHPEIEAIWISRNDSIVQSVRSLGFKAESAYSRAGKWACLRASACFLSEGMWDVVEYCLGGAKKIQLWHGVAFKKIAPHPYLPDSKCKIRPYDFQRMEWMLPSASDCDKFRVAHHTRFSQMHCTGFPRLDKLNQGISIPFFEKLRHNNPEKKIILYMPTHRQFGKNSHSRLSREQLIRMDDSMRRSNMLLLFKPHFHEIPHYKSYGLKLSNIIIATDNELFGDVYEYMHYADAMIADYSSVYIDFSCLDRPIILFPYDLQEFKKADVGLDSVYEEMAPGPICYRWDDVVEQLARQFIHDDYRHQRRTLRMRFHPFNDDMNCKRVFECVIELLGMRKTPMSSERPFNS